MYSESVTYQGAVYQRLSIPGGQKWGAPGYPELPSIGKQLAIPQSSGMSISLEVTDSLVLDGYNLYPSPRISEDTAGGKARLVEVFVKNDSIYSLSQYFPGVQYESADGGYLRSQKVLRMSAFPLRYNPINRQLVVYTEFELNIQFQNPTTEITVNTGLFSKLSRSTLLNYSDQSIPPTPIYPNPNPGTLTWKTLSNPTEADNIVADYVIITDDQFFNPTHSAALTALATQRAAFNGFDVVIVSVQNILSLPFAYDPPSNTDLVSERKIRTFIKQVYDGQHAAHTYDGRVAFICLVGHANLDDDDTGMPTSYDPDPTCKPGFPGEFWSANDFYFSCVTKDNSNNWDFIGDLFIGRLSVRNETDLHNIVNKIKHNENEYTFENWKSVNTLAYGGPFSGANPALSSQYFNVDLYNWLNNICAPAYTTIRINSEVNIPWNQCYANHLNTTGSNLVFHLGHGETDSWCQGGNCYDVNLGALTIGYKMSHLGNTGKYPFVISQSCYTGNYSGAGPDCMGTKSVSYAANAGYVGYLGSWKAAGMNYTQPSAFPSSLQERILGAVFIDLSTMIGEAVLEARIGVSDPTNVSSYNPMHFQHNLFADPAYNVMSTGYEITHNTVLPPAPPLPQTITISTKVYVRSGATLSLSANAVMEFYENGQLIVENGATLELGNNVTIKGQAANNKIIIEGTLCGPGGSISNPVTIANLHLESLYNTTWSGIQFNNPQLIVKLNGGSLSNCYLSGQLTRLEATGSTAFANSRIGLNQSGLQVDGCTFSNSNILLTNNNGSGVFAQIANSTFLNSTADAMIRIEHYPAYSIQNCTITYDHGTGIDLYYCGCSNGQYSVKSNTVQKSGSSQDLSWGIKVYHSFADIENNLITNNRFGVVTLNQSQVRLIGNAAASTAAQTQRIINNYQNQVRASDNSFPFYFHNNIMQNTPSGNTFLVYYDNSGVIDPPASTDNSTLFNVKCNCFDNFNPVPQLYPSGWYQWSIWCPPSSCQFMSQASEDLAIAIASMDSANYGLAETQFKAIIAAYPGTTYSMEAAKKLIPLEKLSGQNFSALISYYDTTAALHTDSISDQLVYRLKNMCTVESENYPAAIDWFENDIMNPASLNDSVYSMIDLSDTYLIMQADSTLKSTQNNYTGKLSQYRPKNQMEHISQSNEWIKLLFRDKLFGDDQKTVDHAHKGFSLEQNNPNPFNTITDLTYLLPMDAITSIVVTNVAGQQVFRTDGARQMAGRHSITVDLSGNPDGLYLITLIADGKTVSKIKAIKIH